MLRVNGLFGWVRSNDQRSLLLFGGFALAFQVAAAVGLFLPLTMFDIGHAPIFAWGGYALRYVPLLLLGSIVLFGLQMLWHVHSVRRTADFTFVDNHDEPRLCRIVELVAMTMGLPAPYVGVIETAAMNAFACGIRRGNAVVVVTRGLIDGLDDEELAAVIAHELAHIANGDIRLMAAANVCLRTVGWVMRPGARKHHPVAEVAAFPLIILLVPPMFLFVLTVSLLGQSSLNASRLVRMLIATSREFVADAAAVEVTQNPAALVSALKRIEGRSRVAGMPPEQDAMLIDGITEGRFATHPSIAERIEAIVAVTGSMALIAPSRRDTRAEAQRSGFGRRAAPRVDAATAEPNEEHAALDDDRDWLGLNPRLRFGALLAVAAFIGFHVQELDRPAQLLATLDPRAFLGSGSACGPAPHDAPTPACGTFRVNALQPDPDFHPVREQMARPADERTR